LINQGANFNLGQAAQCYMNPYLQNQIQQMSNIGQRNIMQNLAPQATAAAVGSGQFGSQRGAQVLGQVEANAEQCLNANIANLLSSGYGQALQAAGTKQGALANLAGTSATAQQAANAAQIQAAQTAANAAQAQGQLGIQGGQGLGTLGTQGQQINLGCLNALSTLGGQQQTIAQNQQCYPLTTLSKLSTLLSGANIPTSTKTQLCMSPLSTLAGVGTGIGALLQPYAGVGTSGYSGAQNMLQGLTGYTSLGGLLKGINTGAQSALGSLTGPQPNAAGAIPDSSSPTGYVDTNGIPVTDAGVTYDASTEG